MTMRSNLSSLESINLSSEPACIICFSTEDFICIWITFLKPFLMSQKHCMIDVMMKTRENWSVRPVICANWCSLLGTEGRCRHHIRTAEINATKESVLEHILHLHRGHVFRQLPTCVNTLINNLCTHTNWYTMLLCILFVSTCLLWGFPSEIILVCLAALFPVIVCLIQCEIPQHSLCFNCTATILCTVT